MIYCLIDVENHHELQKVLNDDIFVETYGKLFRTFYVNNIISFTIASDLPNISIYVCVCVCACVRLSDCVWFLHLSCDYLYYFHVLDNCAWLLSKPLLHSRLSKCFGSKSSEDKTLRL